MYSIFLFTRVKETAEKQTSLILCDSATHSHSLSRNTQFLRFAFNALRWMRTTRAHSHTYLCAYNFLLRASHTCCLRSHVRKHFSYDSYCFDAISNWQIQTCIQNKVWCVNVWVLRWVEMFGYVQLESAIRHFTLKSLFLLTKRNQNRRRERHLENSFMIWQSECESVYVCRAGDFLTSNSYNRWNFITVNDHPNDITFNLFSTVEPLEWYFWGRFCAIGTNCIFYPPFPLIAACVEVDNRRRKIDSFRCDLIWFWR